MNQCVTCGKSIPANSFFCEECKEKPVKSPAQSSRPAPVNQSKTDVILDTTPISQSLSIHPAAKGLAALLWLLSIIGGVYGGLSLILWLETADNAIKQAAAAGMAVGYAVIPYCISRAVTELISLKDK